MPNLPNKWGTDLLPFVGKRFEVEMDRLRRNNKILSLFGQVDTDSLYYDISAGNEFPELPEYDGDLVELDDKRGFNTTVSPKEYMGVFTIHAKQWKNDKSGIIRQAGKKLAGPCYVREVNTVMRLFGNAFDSNYTSGDGKSWAASDHPNASSGSTAGSRLYTADASSGTYSNLFTVGLTTAGIDSMRNAALRFETPGGNMYEGDYTLLLVAPDQEAQAAKMFGRSADLTPKKDPDSAENAASSVSDIRYIVCGGGNASRKLGLPNGTFALVDPMKFKETTLLVYNSRPEYGPMDNINPKKKSFYSYVDVTAGWGDARNILFSSGA